MKYYNSRFSASMVMILVLLAALNAGIAETIYVPAGSVWKYLDNGSDQGVSWRAHGFDDSTWASGPAQLGYGDGDESTTVSFGSNSSNKYITTYFRHVFNVSDINGVSSLKLRLLRDDGAIVYLNGTEILRNNMPLTAINYLTTASSALGGADEDIFLEYFLSTDELNTGQNTIAVEIHQANATSSDISFDLELTGSSDVEITRGPYLQQGSDSSMIIKWNTNIPVNSLIQYGDSVNNLSISKGDPVVSTDHEVKVDNLESDAVYYYAIGYNDDSSGQPVIIAGGNIDHFFRTSPQSGVSKPTRIWIIGDSGTADANAQAVKDAYLSYNTSTTDLWLMLGDNAYNDGTEQEYQSAVFDMYTELLTNTVLWPTLGNHDGHTANSVLGTGPYYDIFSLPTGAESGGYPSGTEAYYSFDYGNIHFICLNSYDIDRSKPENGGVMLTWLEDDLLNTNADWVIAFWHHPPYSKGSHDSDTESNLIEMRENALPILESYGVDLVLSGHSHSYERSILIDSHYGDSDTLDSQMVIDSGDGMSDGDGSYEKPTPGSAPHEGAVYVVAGSSGKTSALRPDAPHPVMVHATLVELGSVILDIDGNTLDAQFLRSDGQIRDYFTIVKGTNPAICGDDTKDAGEACDGSDFGGQTCGDFGCNSGSLTCNPDCTIDVYACTDCPVCDNDGICETGEDCEVCPVDCISGNGSICGNDVCEAADGEDCVSCPNDCIGKQNGKPSGRYCCGDGDGQNPLSCSDPICTNDSVTCTDIAAFPSCCGDSVCESIEDSTNCELDCGPAPFCGDDICDSNEDFCSCSVDCGSPQASETSCNNSFDEDCDGFVDCEDTDCSTDQSCQSSCLPVSSSCSADNECCSNKCRGKTGIKTCR